jgi:hypothetical protein
MNPNYDGKAGLFFIATSLHSPEYEIDSFCGRRVTRSRALRGNEWDFSRKEQKHVESFSALLDGIFDLRGLHRGHGLCGGTYKRFRAGSAAGHRSEAG